MENKLTIAELAPYLPYGLKCKVPFKNGWYHQPKTLTLGNTSFAGDNGWRPVLRPLSDYLDINSDAMNDLNCDITSQINIMDLAHKKIGLSSLSYTDAELCFGAHIDIFGLIEKGLAIDINTINNGTS